MFLFLSVSLNLLCLSRALPVSNYRQPAVRQITFQRTTSFLFATIQVGEQEFHPDCLFATSDPNFNCDQLPNCQKMHRHHINFQLSHILVCVGLKNTSLSRKINFKAFVAKESGITTKHVSWLTLNGKDYLFIPTDALTALVQGAESRPQPYLSADKICFNQTLHHQSLRFIFREPEKRENIIDAWTLSSSAHLPLLEATFEPSDCNGDYFQESNCTLLPISSEQAVCENVWFYYHRRICPHDFELKRIPTDFPYAKICINIDDNIKLSVLTKPISDSWLLSELQKLINWFFDLVDCLVDFIFRLVLALAKRLFMEIPLLGDFLASVVKDLDETYLVFEFSLLFTVITYRTNSTAGFLVTLIVSSFIGFQRNNIPSLYQAIKSALNPWE